MNTKAKIFVGIVLVGVGLVIAMFAFTGGDMTLLTPSDNASSSGTTVEGTMEGRRPGQSNPSGTSGSTKVGMRKVVYTDSGFSPFLVELTAGEEIEFVNKSSGGLWVTTKQHPTAGDQSYEAFDTGRTLKQGETFVFAFTQLGTWGYKNLNNDAHLGAVVVTPQ